MICNKNTQKGRESEANNLQDFDDVAGAEHTVGDGELERLRRWEVGRQDASLDAASPEDLACGAGSENHAGLRRSGARRRTPTTTTTNGGRRRSCGGVTVIVCVAVLFFHFWGQEIKRDDASLYVVLEKR